MNEIFIEICVFLAILSVLSSALVIYAHFKIPQLRKHPGQMIALICVVQLIFDIHWIGSIKSLRK